MQNKGAILTFAILLAAVCFYQLTFTYKAKQIEKDAAEYAQGDPVLENHYLDSISMWRIFLVIMTALKIWSTGCRKVWELN